MLYTQIALLNNRQMRIQRLFPTIILFFSSILWGLSWLPLKALADLGVNSLVIISVAYGCLFIASFPLVWRSIRYYMPNALALIGIFLAGGLANVCFNYALIQGEVLRVMVLFYLLPVWGVLGGRFILKEATSTWRWVGVVLAIAGAAILLDFHQVLRQSVSWVDLIAIASGLFFAATILLFRGVEGVPLAVKLNTLFLGTSTIATLALLFIFAGAPLRMAAPKLAWIIAFALGWLLWANLGSQWACTKLPAGRTSIIMVMELVAASVSAVIIGGETLSASLVLSGALIFSATVIEILDGIERKK